MRILLIIIAVFSLQFTKGQEKNTETRIGLDQFMDMRFGMFIHWGPVSLRGAEIGWSRGHQVEAADYDNLYKEFNPVLFDADAIVATAKEAGMKYLTITAKHHDGYCLWPSAFTEYDISVSPYKKDIVGELARACKEQEIEFCIYYSVLDWWHPDYPIHRAGDEEHDPKSNMPNYVLYMKNQLKELIDLYDPTMLWFDGAWETPWTDETGLEMYNYLKEIKPSLVINNRLGKEIAAVDNKVIDVSKMIGDYDTPEQVVGRMNMEVPWESSFTICNQWAWKPNDPMKSLDQCLDILSKVVGGNGNLLLNVGPMPDGRIEQRQVDRLKEIGTWLAQHQEAVYKTLGGPYKPTDDYTATRKNNKIFLHIINEKAKEITLPINDAFKINNIYTLDGEELKYTTAEKQVFIKLPANRTINYVVTMDVNNNIEQLAVFD